MIKCICQALWGNKTQLKSINNAPVPVCDRQTNQSNNRCTLQNFTWIWSKFIVYTGYIYKSWNWKEKKKTLHTTEIIPKSIYRYIFLVNTNYEKRLDAVSFAYKIVFFLSQHEVGGQCLVSCKARTNVSSHCGIGNIVTLYAMIIYRHCSLPFRVAMKKYFKC